MKYNIRGIQPLTCIDYPGEIAAVAFFEGCNLRCPYCHNTQLLFPAPVSSFIRDRDFDRFLETRKGMITGIVLSGGEPMLSMGKGLEAVIAACKASGYKVKLDTNGSIKIKGTVLEDLLDCIAIDIKFPEDKVSKVTSRCPDQYIRCYLENLHSNLDLLGTQFAGRSEVRTTVHKKLLSPEDLQHMKEQYIDPHGSIAWFLQQFRMAEGIPDESLASEETYSDNEIVKMARDLGAVPRGCFTT